MLMVAGLRRWRAPLHAVPSCGAGVLSSQQAHQSEICTSGVPQVACYWLRPAWWSTGAMRCVQSYSWMQPGWTAVRAVTHRVSRVDMNGCQHRTKEERSAYTERWQRRAARVVWCADGARGHARREAAAPGAVGPARECLLHARAGPRRPRARALAAGRRHAGRPPRPGGGRWAGRPARRPAARARRARALRYTQRRAGPALLCA